MDVNPDSGRGEETCRRSMNEVEALGFQEDCPTHADAHNEPRHPETQHTASAVGSSRLMEPPCPIYSISWDKLRNLHCRLEIDAFMGKTRDYEAHFPGCSRMTVEIVRKLVETTHMVPHFQVPAQSLHPDVPVWMIETVPCPALGHHVPLPRYPPRHQSTLRWVLRTSIPMGCLNIPRLKLGEGCPALWSSIRRILSKGLFFTGEEDTSLGLKGITFDSKDRRYELIAPMSTLVETTDLLCNPFRKRTVSFREYIDLGSDFSCRHSPLSISGLGDGERTIWQRALSDERKALRGIASSSIKAELVDYPTHTDFYHGFTMESHLRELSPFVKSLKVVFGYVIVFVLQRTRPATADTWARYRNAIKYDRVYSVGYTASPPWQHHDPLNPVDVSVLDAEENRFRENQEMVWVPVPLNPNSLVVIPPCTAYYVYSPVPSIVARCDLMPWDTLYLTRDALRNQYLMNITPSRGWTISLWSLLDAFAISLRRGGDGEELLSLTPKPFHLIASLASLIGLRSYYAHFENPSAWSINMKAFHRAEHESTHRSAEEVIKAMVEKYKAHVPGYANMGTLEAQSLSKKVLEKMHDGDFDRFLPPVEVQERLESRVRRYRDWKPRPVPFSFCPTVV